MWVSSYRTGSPPGILPLSFDASQKFLRTAQGAPFLMIGDSPTSIEVQCTRAQVDVYLNDRQARGVNTISFNALEHKFSSQTPAYQNVAGDNPFTSQPGSTDFSTPNSPYWQVVDYIVAGAEARGIFCFIAPCYLGFGGGTEGWDAEITADTAAHLQAYGAFLAARYPRVGWIYMGDYNGADGSLTKQRNVFLGMLSVTSRLIVTGWPGRADGESYPLLSGFPEFNLNSTYAATDGSNAYSLSATAFARSMPHFLIEAGVEPFQTAVEMRRAMYGSLFSGACGYLFQNDPLWGFGEPVDSGGLGAANALATALNTVGIQQVTICKQLMTSYAWWKLVPSTGTGLVTTSLSTGTTRLFPTLASDGTFGFVFVPSAQTVTLNMAAFSNATVRVRLFDPTSGAFTSVGSFANTGTQNVTTTAEQIIVCD